jgi:hypothetical protein
MMQAKIFMSTSIKQNPNTSMLIFSLPPSTWMKSVVALAAMPAASSAATAANKIVQMALPPLGWLVS